MSTIGKASLAMAAGVLIVATTASAAVTQPELTLVYGKKSESDGAMVVRYQKKGSPTGMDPSVDLKLDIVNIEDSPFWKWKSGSPNEPCHAGIAPDPCADAPVCTVSGLHRPDFDFDFYKNKGASFTDEEGTVIVGEYSTEKPRYNVNSVIVQGLGPDGKGRGKLLTYYPNESGVMTAVCEQLDVTVSIKTHEPPSSSEPDPESQLEQITAEAGMFQQYPDKVFQTIEITDATGEELFSLYVARANDAAGAVVAISGYDAVAPSEVSTSIGAEAQALLKQVDTFPTSDLQCDAYTPDTKPDTEAGAPELQGFDWKNDKDGNLYTALPDFSAPPTHPAPFGWLPNNSWNAHDGIRVTDLNCQSDGALLNILGSGGIYNQWSGTAGYMYNGLWTQDNQNEITRGKKGQIKDQSEYTFIDNFPGKTNDDWITNQYVVCPNTPLEMTCSSVHFSKYGNVSYWNAAQREIKCVKENKYYSDEDYQKMVNTWNASAAKYAQCPDKNPLKDFPLPTNSWKEVFVIFSGSIGTVDGGDFFGKGGNVSARPSFSETQYLPKACFRHRLGVDTQYVRSCSVSGLDVPCHSTDSERRGDTIFYTNLHGAFSYPYVDDTNKTPGPVGGVVPVTRPAVCDPTKVQIQTTHFGVKGEVNIHRDRAWIEAMTTDPDTNQPYARITYLGHSRGGAKVNYAAHRHKTLWPDDNVRVISLGTMGAFRGEVVTYDGANWTRSKGYGDVFAKLPKTQFINMAQKCSRGQSKADFAPYILSALDYSWDFKQFNMQFNVRMCEKTKIKKKGWFNDEKRWKVWFNTDNLASIDASKKIHFTYTSFAYYARGFDKLFFENY